MDMSTVTTTFYTTSHEAWDAMLADLSQAKVSIDIEQYIFTPDSIGKKFINLLREKAAQGVRIRLFLDTVGSYTFYRSPIAEELRAIGIAIKFFNPVSPWRITNFTSNFFRDHRKIIIVDNVIGHVGGVGIDIDMENWRDTHLRVTGPLVLDLHNSFESVWNNLHKRLFTRFGRPHFLIRHYTFLTNSPSLRRSQRYIYQTLIANIRNAEKCIYLTTPYFIPDRRLFRVLRLAAKRGVDVRLILPSVADHYFVDHARESYFALALKAGIKISVYKPVMMHAKTAVVDDVWAMAGSFNLDSLSFIFNHEASIASTDAHFISTLKEHFLRDLDYCEDIIYEKWIYRPLRKKFLELLTWPFHGLM